MTRFALSCLVASAAVLCGGAQEAPAERPIRMTTDAAELSRCMGGLVGFRNVPIRCTVGTTGALQQCELLTQNRDVLRLRPRFECMAAAITVVHEDDGTPAVGRVVQTRLQGVSRFSS